MLRYLVPGVLCVALTACGGGSGGGSSLPALGGSGTATPGAPVSPQGVTLSITIPRASKTASAIRRPLYVSTATQSAAIVIDGGTPIVQNLTAGSPNCTQQPAGLTCTQNVQISAGQHTLTESLYAQLNAGGSVLSTGTTTATIVAGKANAIALTLSGIAAGINVALANATPPKGTPASVPVNVTLLDAGGAAIVGPDVTFSPITLSDSDGSQATSLTKTTLNTVGELSSATLKYNGDYSLGKAVIGAAASGIASTNVAPATFSPAAKPSSLTDYTTYGYDNARDGYNPNSKAFTPGAFTPNNAGQIPTHLAWQSSVDQSVQLSGSQTQPIVATNVGTHAGMLIVGGVNGDFYGFDALNGSRVWKTPSLGDEQYTCSYGGSNIFHVGVGGTAAYDPGSQTFYATANNNGANGLNGAAANTLYRFDAATGGMRGNINLVPDAYYNEIDFAHTAVTIGPNGMVYAGIGSTCDVSNTRGRVVEVNPNDFNSVANTFFTTWGGSGQPYAGGGVWGWGGVSIDGSNNVYAATGNTWDARNAGQVSAPFATAPSENSAYGENILKFNANLGVTDADAPNFPIGAAPKADDLDFTGTPTLYQPLGCSVMAAAQGKAGQLLMFDTTNLAQGPVTTYQFSQPIYYAAYLGNPTFSPVTGLLYANVASSQGGSIRPPGLVAIRPGCGGNTQILWNATYGPDSFGYATPISRGVPTVTAGGVVLASTPCTPDGNGGCGAPAGVPGGAVWAIDASAGSVLNGGKPILITPGQIRMAPTVDGNWIYVYDNNGDLYGLTVDGSIPRVSSKSRQTLARDMTIPSH